MEQKTLFKIRDLRKADQFKIDDKYINGYAKLCGVYATAVYNSLSRHAEFNTQKCFPSIELIAEQHNISKPTAIKGIRKLEEFGIIQVEKGKDIRGRQKPNLYILIDKSDWKPIRVNEVDSDNRVKEINEPSKSHDENRVKEVYCKDTKIKDTHIKDIAKPSFALNDLIDLFKGVNPCHEKLFANKTQRSALERLVEKHGEEKVKGMISIIPETNKKKYFPTICSPLELENKLGTLIACISREKLELNKNKIVKI